jgi:hypothetical protein
MDLNDVHCRFCESPDTILKRVDGGTLVLCRSCARCFMVQDTDTEGQND